VHIKKHIPNLLTLGNLISGSLAVILISQNSYDSSFAILIFLAGIFDVFDGAIARALKVSDDLGKQLDSLADVISFGLAPSVIIYSALEMHLPFQMQWIKYFAFLNVACAAIRLGRFNIATDQSTDFSGMPSPANGLFWASVSVMMFQTDHIVLFTENSPYLFPCMVLLFLAITSWLMISPVRMFSFKFKPGGFNANRIPFIYIGAILIIAVVGLLQQNFYTAIPVALVLYMVTSFIYHFTQKSQASIEQGRDA
jgi:CDP-diacylglycerol---serine O-phosphatidyltransferase